MLRFVPELITALARAAETGMLAGCMRCDAALAALTALFAAAFARFTCIKHPCYERLHAESRCTAHIDTLGIE